MRRQNKTAVAITMTAMLAPMAVLAAFPKCDVAFSVAQIEKGAPALVWTRQADGSETTVLGEADAGIDLAGVALTRQTVKGEGFETTVFTLVNGTEELRYASFGWRAEFQVVDSGDSNWFPTTDNVLDLTSSSALWGYYSKPGEWQFSLVEPWFAAYHVARRKGFAFVFDFNHLAAAYGANDMKTRGVLFDGGLLPPGATFSTRFTVRELAGLPSIATVNEKFAAGFSGPATSPVLTVQVFEDLRLEGAVTHADVNGVKLGEAAVAADLKAGEVENVCVVRSEKPATQSVLSADFGGVTFECFRENGFRMASLPMVPAVWTHTRPMPRKQLASIAEVKQTAQDKALLLFGFYANFFGFEAMFPTLDFTVVSAPPPGIVDVPPASRMGEYRYVFLGDVNEESVRPMMARLAAYVRNGGTLVVGGGPFAYGCGGYTGSFIEEMLPVTTFPFDCRPACEADPDGRTAVAFSAGDAKLFWIHKLPVKPGAEVLLKAGDDPLLVRGRYGHGTVYAFLGAPIGDEARDAKAFWNGNTSYLRTMAELLK